MMAAPFDVIVQATFQEVQKFVDGDGQTFGWAVLSAGLVFHAILGGAELVSGQPSRLTKGTFWVRVVFILVLLSLFDTIFLNFTKTIMTSALGDIFPSWVALWKGFFATAVQNFDNANKFSGVGSAAQIFLGSANDFVNSIIVASGIFVAVLALILIFLNAIFGMGASALVVCFAPICIPFGIHEVTEDIAKSYFKTWLAYSVLLLPMLTIAMRIAVAMQGPLLTTVGQATMPDSIADGISQMVAMIIGPISGLGLVLAAPMVVKNVLK